MRNSSISLEKMSCPTCEKLQLVELITYTSHIKYHGKEISFTSKCYQCTKCFEMFDTIETLNDNLAEARKMILKEN